MDTHLILRELTLLTNGNAVAALAALTVLNVVAALANVVAFARNRRRLRRVAAREQRLAAGPVTAAVGTFAHLSTQAGE